LSRQFNSRFTKFLKLRKSILRGVYLRLRFLMKKEDLIILLNSLLLPLNFKKKGNNWLFNGEILSKVVNLQKSDFGNYYYLNYGFTIAKLELTTTTHIHYRLASTNSEENIRIKDLLDLESNIEPEQRIFELENLIKEKIINQMTDINNEAELLSEIKKMPYSSIIPLVVKQHFNLSEW